LTLEAGKLADLVILDLVNVTVLETIKEGRSVFQAAH
jgi:predicted amidohydrolase YtcJ